jgi:hypothetical protein
VEASGGVGLGRTAGISTAAAQGCERRSGKGRKKEEEKDEVVA